MKKIKIFCTLGPSSLEPNFLKFANKNIDLLRLNMSHLNINELKRISSFPDDFILHGNLYQKWERVGRAVPPLMMAKVAETVAKEILEKI